MVPCIVMAFVDIISSTQVLGARSMRNCTGSRFHETGIVQSRYPNHTGQALDKIGTPTLAQKPRLKRSIPAGGSEICVARNVGRTSLIGVIIEHIYMADEGEVDIFRKNHDTRALPVF
jgi:hypothetical protein